jgi:hypothetical protein
MSSGKLREVYEYLHDSFFHSSRGGNAVDLHHDDTIAKVEELKAHIESIARDEDRPIDVVLGLLKSAGYSGKGSEDGGHPPHQQHFIIGDKVELLDHRQLSSSVRPQEATSLERVDEPASTGAEAARPVSTTSERARTGLLSLLPQIRVPRRNDALSAPDHIPPSDSEANTRFT